MAKKKIYKTKKVLVSHINLSTKKNITENDVCKDFARKKNLRGKLMMKDTEEKKEVRYIRFGNRIGIEQV